ncbi:hypothetical protein [Lichenibacterium dinghuense]|uniref:hypothetical protein n=1 Tax=Lichenibacterium dinghuense TaxID=2895977 RepID=UPI001F46BA32|nr:hypothetical protein [Lichenibacterium sp. 6Y81]
MGGAVPVHRLRPLTWNHRSTICHQEERSCRTPTRNRRNLRAVGNALAAAATDFSRFGAAIFANDIACTITGYGLVARASHGVDDLIEYAARALFDRWDGTTAVETKGVWADGDKVFVHMTSSARAVDGLPYANEYMYILMMLYGNVVVGTAWLDLYAYYDIIDRVNLPS